MGKKNLPAINESELDDIQPVSMRRIWFMDHLKYFIIAGAILLLIGVYFGVRWYNNATHPITRFMNASAKSFNSSFTFELEAQKNGEAVMRYSGAYEADSSKQNLSAYYDADYGDYTFSGAVYAEGDTRYSGSCYENKWRVRDCTERILNFFDFNTDYRRGEFDGASFLRFTDLTSQYSARELTEFMKLFKSRMGGSDPLASVTVDSENGSKTYTYAISPYEFFNLVRDKGASIFFSALDYDAFCALYEKNMKNVRSADCSFSFTVNGSGYLSGFALSLTVGGEEYAVHCAFDNFGEAAVELPQAFLDALPAL